MRGGEGVGKGLCIREPVRGGTMIVRVSQRGGLLIMAIDKA